MPKQETRSYQHSIFHNFESCSDKTKKNEVTASFTYENDHVPILVCFGDRLEHEPTHICDANPKKLIRKFVEELERGGKTICTVAKFMTEVLDQVSGKQRGALS